LNARLTLFAIVAALTCVSTAGAQGVGPHTGNTVDSRTLRVQEKVENLFVAGEYERAYTIYRHDLAPIGDKYAQYMVGFMLLEGLGVDQDPLLASAWYRLAAERASSEFLLERDRLLSGMSEANRVRSDHLYTELREQYSDAVLLLKLIRDDYRMLSTITGSRTAGGASPVVSVDVRTGESMAASERVRMIQSRIESRLAFMAKTLAMNEIQLDAEDLDFEALQAQVDQYVSTIKDREESAARAIDR
jgi:TPR repeat protein